MTDPTTILGTPVFGNSHVRRTVTLIPNYLPFSRTKTGKIIMRSPQRVGFGGLT